MRWWAPAFLIMLAISLAVMGDRRLDFWSPLEYGKYGVMTVMDWAEARRQELMISSSSITASLELTAPAWVHMREMMKAGRVSPVCMM